MIQSNFNGVWALFKNKEYINAKKWKKSSFFSWYNKETWLIEKDKHKKIA